jgi:hypothetical protein
MPIHPRYRWFYPIDWPQLSAVIRFRRAQGKCEGCGRPHGAMVCHLGDGRWWDRDQKQWRDGRGRPLRRLPALWLWKGAIRTTRVVLACSHLDHDPTNNRPSNLKAFCQRCHMLHDRPEHRRRRWFTTFRRRALGDLYQGRYN